MTGSELIEAGKENAKLKQANEELEVRLSNCKFFIDYLLMQTKDAEKKNERELYNALTSIEYEAHQLLIEEF